MIIKRKLETLNSSKKLQSSEKSPAHQRQAKLLTVIQLGFKKKILLLLVAVYLDLSARFRKKTKKKNTIGFLKTS
jgi:hypothetical protein